jgi:hypothetical protein
MFIQYAGFFGKKKRKIAIFTPEFVNDCKLLNYLNRQKHLMAKRWALPAKFTTL